MPARRTGGLAALLRRVALAARRDELFVPGETVVAAVSGGGDSVFLLHALAALAPELGLQLHVAHFDHGWRDDAAEDAAFVRTLAERMDLPVHEGRSAKRLRPRVDGLSPEEAARSARYGFLFSLARQLGGGVVATGHTQDDQVESVLLALLRGSGPLGLGGMAPRSVVRPPPTDGATGVGLARPLLGVARESIRAALAASGQTWREDPTNDDVRFPRNRLRRDVLPQLEAITPGFRRAVLRSAALAREAGSFVRQEAERQAQALFTMDAGYVGHARDAADAADGNGGERAGDGDATGGARCLRAKRSALLALHPALRGEALRWAAAQLQGTAHDLEWAHVQGALETIERGRGGAVAWLSRRLRVRLERADVVVELAAQPPGAPSTSAEQPSVTIRRQAP